MTVLNLCKSYGEKAVLNNFSAHFDAGEISALMGPSGCGKTTLFRILLGIEKADAGEIRHDGAKTVAVFQEDRLSEPLSAIKNVCLGRRDATPDEAKALLSALGLAEDAEKSVKELSGGMRRRVSIARALIADADTVLLDEPFSALDEDTKASVMRFTRKALEGKTVVLITHDIEEARAFAKNRVYPFLSHQG
ncbi:MAG: ATP-binding cassette domain-containing protein [Ruminococcaceae bacterium]|nr:ATP-binding cassette domain-containing protein [Oscillospiraceae bacterium]